MNRAILITAALALFSAAAHSGAFYKWKDENGQIHYTQSPPPAGAQKVEPNPDATSSIVDEGEWSPRKKQLASEFMGKARVKRVWKYSDGSSAPGWY